MKRLALFDIDKTLIKSAPGHAESFCYGLKEGYGIDVTPDFVYANSEPADQQTLRRVLKLHRFRGRNVDIDLPVCLQAIGDYFYRIKNSLQIDALEGAVELVKELNRRKYLLGLFTGNLESIARGKLERAGLENYFKFGGFGSDALTKNGIARIVMQRAQDKFNFSLDQDKAFLFGDSPYEIKAGREVGITSIGVATGKYSCEHLQSAGADYVFPDLKDTQGIISVLEN